MKMTRETRGVLMLALSVAVVVALIMPPTARADEDVVRVGDLVTISNAGLYIAIEKGYFRDQRIKNDISTFASAAKSVPAMAAGELDVAVGAAATSRSEAHTSEVQ